MKVPLASIPRPHDASLCAAEARKLAWLGRLIVALMQREAQALRAAPANDSAESTVR